MTWMLTGGAGYIGAHVLRALQSRGFDVMVLDDLSSGSLAVVPVGVEVVQASVLDTAAVADAMRAHGVVGVVHLAAKKAPGESVTEPLFYYRQNVDGMASVLEAMRQASVSRIVLSSSSSVYGNTDQDPIGEDTPFNPESPYGQTKVVSEWLVRAAATAYGLDYVNLRYFNVAGAVSPELLDKGTANLIPRALQALRRGETPQVFGTDYDTPDGSCIRDYIHVGDLADAHALAANSLMDKGVRATYNVGTGRGYTVFEVLDMIGQTTGLDFDPIRADRRAGDPVRSVGDVRLIGEQLGWHARRDLAAMVASTWDGMQTASA